MKKKRITKGTKTYLGPARVRQLVRVANLGQRLVTPKLTDEFSQMSVSECREYVRGIEGWFNRKASKAGY